MLPRHMNWRGEFSCVGSAGRWMHYFVRVVETYKNNGRESHSFKFDVEFIAGLDLSRGFRGLGFDGFDEALGPLWVAGEVEELGIGSC